ncbi:MAG: ROK family protein [Candidatus Gastranaerophilales bacterium]|nr:ROK family protein [Candidatus Gastranaerophilales bacterium]
MYSLGIDIGGTKISAGIVEDGKILCCHSKFISESKNLEIPNQVQDDEDRQDAGKRQDNKSGVVDTKDKNTFKILNQIPDKTGVFNFKTPKTAQAILDLILEIIEKFSEKYTLSAVGIATAGAVNLENSKVIGSTGNLPHGYSNIEFKKTIEEKFNIKTFIENDANAAAYAEYKIGAAKGHQNTIIITLGTGIGGGIIINGSLLRGKSGAAAEVGHIPICVNENRDCTCGYKNCWESYASGTGYAKTAIEMAKKLEDKFLLNGKKPDEITTYDIIEWKKQGNKFAQAVHQKWKNYVFAGLVALANIFDPDSIVLSGGMAEFIDFSCMENRLNQSTVVAPVKLLHAKTKNHAGFIGAVLLAEKLI